MRKPYVRTAPFTRVYPRISAVDRIMARVVETPGPLSTDCWRCTFAPDLHGYTMVATDGRKTMAHRVLYERFVGPVPDGLELDHLCRVPACVNPSHMEPVTHAENVRRGVGPSAIAARTNTCQRGHSLDDAYVNADGRRCRTCSLARRAARSRQAA